MAPSISPASPLALSTTLSRLSRSHKTRLTAAGLSPLRLSAPLSLLDRGHEKGVLLFGLMYKNLSGGMRKNKINMTKKIQTLSKSITDENGDVGTLPNEFFDKAVRGEPQPNDKIVPRRKRSVSLSQVTAKPMAKSVPKAKLKNLASS
jgi:hypothetical protein